MDWAQIRFSSDLPVIGEEDEQAAYTKQNKSLRRLLYSSISVREETFPRLYSVLKTTFSNLEVDFSNFDFFVHASAEMQAFALLESDAYPLFVFTSALIERLSDKELSFVIGHEYGHFLFKHGQKNPIEEEDFPLGDLYFQILQRASEISADRVGLLACRDLKSALSALIKITSGLSESNIRFSVNIFLKQFDELLARGPNIHEMQSTHPIFLLRLRSLIAFGRSQVFLNSKGFQRGGLSKEEIDGLVERDFKRASGFSLEEIATKVTHEISLYSAFSSFFEDGCFSREEQKFASKFFGQEEIQKMVNAMRTQGISRIKESCAVRKLFAQRLPLPEPQKIEMYEFDTALRKIR